MAASRATWPLGRGFDRWYGFHGGETHQFMPALYHDNHASPPASIVRGGLSPERGPCRPRHRVPRRPARRRRRPTLLPCISAPERVTRRITPPRSGSSVTRATSPADGTAGEKRRSPANSSSGSSPPAPSCHHARRGSRRGRPSGTANGNWPSGSWSASPPTCRTPTRRSAGCSISSTTWVTRRTPSSWWCRTTGRARRVGWKARSTTSACRTSTRRGFRRCTGASTRSAGPSPTTTTHGAGPWRVIRPSSAGSERSTKVASPIRASCRFPRAEGSRPEAIRYQYAHAVDVLPTVLELVGISAPEEIDGIAAVASRWHQLRLPPR